MATTMFECALCPRVDTSKIELDRHMASYHNNAKHICLMCMTGHQTKNKFREHLRICHCLEIKSQYLKNKLIKCEFCSDDDDDSCWVSEAELSFHMSSYHTQEFPWSCPSVVCELGLASGPLLKQHVLLAHPSDDCKRGNRIKWGHKRLRRHQQNLTCEICGDWFADANGLKNHSWTHIRERWYACDLCDAAFSNLKGLKIHFKSKKHEQNIMRVKEGGEAAAAAACERSSSTTTDHVTKFARLEDIPAPKRRNGWVSCMVPGCGFKRREPYFHCNMKIHLQNVHLLRTLQCDFCERTFGHKSTLEGHVRTCRQNPENEQPTKKVPCPNEVRGCQSIITNKPRRLSIHLRICKYHPKRLVLPAKYPTLKQQSKILYAQKEHVPGPKKVEWIVDRWKYWCGVPGCERKPFSKNHLDKHINRVHLSIADEETFACNKNPASCVRVFLLPGCLQPDHKCEFAKEEERKEEREEVEDAGENVEEQSSEDSLVSPPRKKKRANNNHNK